MRTQNLKIVTNDKATSFYINGSLQFDSRDEHIYHEYLTRPAVLLAGARQSFSGRALILGGGDGLAARDLLASPDIVSVDIVDYDADVLTMARGELASVNRGAFWDPRVHVFCMDAHAFLATAPKDGYDVIIIDLTFPEDILACDFFTMRFYTAVKSHLKADGILAINGVSPEMSPVAFWSIFRTLGAAGFSVRPYQARIPSFIKRGYGIWGFFLASPQAITSGELRRLSVRGGALISRRAFLKTMNFPAQRVLFGLACAREAQCPSDIWWALNIQLPVLTEDGAVTCFSGKPFTALEWQNKFDASASLAISLSEWIARHLTMLEGFDWKALMGALENFSEATAGGMLTELENLRRDIACVAGKCVPSREGTWRFVTALVSVIILINTIMPDYAFAKGHQAAGVSGDIIWNAPVAAMPFRMPYIANAEQMPLSDIKGRSFNTEFVYYVDEEGNEKEEVLFYRLTDYVFLSARGGIYSFLPGGSYYTVVAQGQSFLFRLGESWPIFSFALDAQFLSGVQADLERQEKLLGKTLDSYEKWLAWEKPGALVSQQVRHDFKEEERLKILLVAFQKAQEIIQQNVTDPATTLAEIWNGVLFSSGGSLLLRKEDDIIYTVKYKKFPAENKYPLLIPDDRLELFLDDVVRFVMDFWPEYSPVKTRVSQIVGQAD